MQINKGVKISFIIMKVLITTDLYLPTINGVVTSVLNLKKELIKRGHEVKILTLVQADKDCNEKDTYYIKSFSVGKIYPQARFMRSFGTKQMLELIEWKPDVIHSQCEFSTYFFARHIARKTGAPIIHTYHTIYEDYTHYFSFSHKVGKKTAKIFTKVILRKTQDVIAPTEKVNRLLQTYHINKPIYTIPTGIDVDKYAKEISLEMRNQRRRALGISKEQIVLIYLGRVAKEKNIEEVADYVLRLDNPDIRLLIVGDGPERKELEEYVKKIDVNRQIIFIGKVDRDKVGEYYQLADVFVSASTSETQGLTYIEALANGIPLLCHRDECLDDVIEEGVNGFQYHNFDEFKQYLNILEKGGYIDDRYKKSARIKAERFSTEKFAESVEQVYYSAILENNKKCLTGFEKFDKLS